VPDRHDIVAALEADLAALAAAEADLERDAEVAERTRIERSSVTLEDRMRGTAGPVEVALLGGWRTSGQVVEVGDGWVLLGGGPTPTSATPAEHLVQLRSVGVVRGLGRSALTASALGARSTTSVLRAWCRDRSAVTVRLVDGSVVSGLASAAYADHVEIVTDGADGTVALPLSAVAVVSR